MNKSKLFLILMALSYSLFLGSFVYISPTYKELFIFLQIVTLPAIYAVGFEILMDKQKEEFNLSYSKLKNDFENINSERKILTENIEKNRKS
ncbi:hypothetical protein HYX11_01320 [Candidatus Woesearchaeota archaeon]|nr:hypothetical protein [Candidatus Woesearchaeota archaeon]